MKATLCLVGLLFFFFQGISQERKQAISNMKKLTSEIKKDEKEIVDNNNKIASLKAKSNTWRSEQSSKLEKARKALQDKLYEIENSESWKNRKKTAQSGYKEYNPGTCNAGGPPPICSAGHWYHVGYADAMREYERYKKEVLDKLRNKISEIDKSYNKKIRDAENQIDDLSVKNNNLTWDLPKKKTAVSNAAYDWQFSASKENEEKDAEWKEAVTKEEAYKKVLEHNLDEIDNKIANANSEYLDAYTENHRKIQERYEDQKQSIEDQKYNTERNLDSHTFQSKLDADKLKSDVDYARRDLERMDNKWKVKELATEKEKEQYNLKRAALQNDIQQKESLYNQHLASSSTKTAELQNTIGQYDQKLNTLDNSYSGSVANLETQLKESFENREGLLQQMKSQVKQQIAGHRSLMESNKMVRQAEIDEWNRTKKTEIEEVNNLCSSVDQYCGSVYSPLNYLPEADIDIIGDLFDGIPGGGILEEFADKILRLPKGAVMPPTYKAGKNGSQSYFESKIGVERFLSLKARFEDDPLNPDKGLDMSMCLEALGNNSCFGARENKQTGEWETYSEGVFKQNMESLKFKPLDLKDYERELKKTIKK